jgi:hypothetical protein
MWGLPYEITNTTLCHHEAGHLQKPLEILKATKKFESLSVLKKLEVINFLAALSGDLVHDALKQPWRKTNGGTLSQAGASALYEMNFSPSKLISEDFLKKIQVTAQVFVQ